MRFTDKETARKLGANLAAARRDRHLAGAVAAKLIGISKPKLYRIERGAVGCDVGVLLEFARLYGCAIETLLLGLPDVRQVDGRMRVTLRVEHRTTIKSIADRVRRKSVHKSVAKIRRSPPCKSTRRSH